jgi:hypothetical protein
MGLGLGLGLEGEVCTLQSYYPVSYIKIRRKSGSMIGRRVVTGTSALQPRETSSRRYSANSNEVVVLEGRALLPIQLVLLMTLLLIVW